MEELERALGEPDGDAHHYVESEYETTVFTDFTGAI